MMENGKISAAFVKAQKEFAPALKTKTNPAFKSRYVGLDGCIEAVIDALNDNGIALIQRPSDCETGIRIETVFLHESGEQLSGGVLYVPANKHDAQGYGSALTYARRYGLMSACGIAPEDDDGNAASKPGAKPAPAANFDSEIAAMKAAKTIDSLKSVWEKFDGQTKHALKPDYIKIGTDLQKAQQDEDIPQ